MHLTLQVGGNISLSSSVDVSFSFHEVMNINNGATLTMGGGHVYSEIGKQSLVTKSSTEAERVRASDVLGQTI